MSWLPRNPYENLDDGGADPMSKVPGGFPFPMFPGGGMGGFPPMGPMGGGIRTPPFNPNPGGGFPGAPPQQAQPTHPWANPEMSSQGQAPQIFQQQENGQQNLRDMLTRMFGLGNRGGMGMGNGFGMGGRWGGGGWGGGMGGGWPMSPASMMFNRGLGGGWGQPTNFQPPMQTEQPQARPPKDRFTNFGWGRREPQTPDGGVVNY